MADRYYVAAAGTLWGVHDASRGTAPHHPRIADFHPIQYGGWNAAYAAASAYCADLNGPVDNDERTTTSDLYGPDCGCVGDEWCRHCEPDLWEEARTTSDLY